MSITVISIFSWSVVVVTIVCVLFHDLSLLWIHLFPMDEYTRSLSDTFLISFWKSSFIFKIWVNKILFFKIWDTVDFLSISNSIIFTTIIFKRGFMLRCFLVVVDKNFFLQFNNQILGVNSYFFCLLPFESCNTFCLGTLELYLSVVGHYIYDGGENNHFRTEEQIFGPCLNTI